MVYLDFTAYGRDDDAKGTVAIAIGDVGGVTAEGGDIRYYTDYSGRVQINANDIARFFEESYPGYTLQYVTLEGAAALRQPVLQLLRHQRVRHVLAACG